MKNNQQVTQMVKRFSVLQRTLHWVVMLGFIGLGLTGFSLAYSDQWWGQAVAWLVGGASHLGWVHRACAVATYGAVVVHLLWLAYFKLVLGGRLTGADSMFPTAKDFSDLAAHLKYIFAAGPAPRFGRFSYLEKADYWAVLIGMNTMGITGLVMWFPEWFSSFLPGYLINLAMILHFYEAVLAVAIKFVVHVYTAHLRPEVFPLEKNIFSGYEPIDRLKHERPAQWEALQAAAEGSGGEGVQ